MKNKIIKICLVIASRANYGRVKSLIIELKKNPNPSQAAVLYDQKIKQLWSSAENSSLANADNFTRKALEQKFYATANVFKQDVIKGFNSLKKENLRIL